MLNSFVMLDLCCSCMALWCGCWTGTKDSHGRCVIVIQRVFALIQSLTTREVRTRHGSLINSTWVVISLKCLYLVELFNTWTSSSGDNITLHCSITKRKQIYWRWHVKKTLKVKKGLRKNNKKPDGKHNQEMKYVAPTENRE